MGGAHWRHLVNTMDRSITAAAAIRAVTTITIASCLLFELCSLMFPYYRYEIVPF